VLLSYIERCGVSLEDDVATADKFDPKYLSKIVD
jgi:serine O-acetyltransferase